MDLSNTTLQSQKDPPPIVGISKIRTSILADKIGRGLSAAKAQPKRSEEGSSAQSYRKWTSILTE